MLRKGREREPLERERCACLGETEYVFFFMLDCKKTLAETVFTSGLRNTLLTLYGFLSDSLGRAAAEGVKFGHFLSCK